MYRPIPEPFCPICGHPDPKLLSQRDVSHDDPFPSPKEAEETAYTFKCRCGVTFIHTVAHKRPMEVAR